MYLFIGGDKRIAETYNLLKSTCDCKIFLDGTNEDTDELFAQIKTADNIILPIPYTRDNKYIFAPHSKSKVRFADILSTKKATCRIFFGAAKNTNSIDGINFLDIDEYVLNNAYLTSKSLLDIIKEKHSLKDKKILVAGYGRIAKCILNEIKDASKNIYVALRKKEIFDDIKNIGFIPIDIRDINTFCDKVDIAINTIPCVYFHEKFFDLHPAIDYYDIASHPHGTEIKRENNHLLLGLPGKYYPQEEASCIHKIILNIAGGDGMWKKGL